MCKRCKKHRDQFKERLEGIETPRQKRIRERTERIDRRNERIARRNENPLDS